MGGYKPSQTASPEPHRVGRIWQGHLQRRCCSRGLSVLRKTRIGEMMTQGEASFRTVWGAGPDHSLPVFDVRV